MIERLFIHSIFYCSLLLSVFGNISWAQAASKNGFDLSQATIASDEIFAGGPPRDGIPAINQPKFVAVSAVDFLHDDDIVIGVVHHNIARAYPTRILIWHEIVNDRIDDHAFAVTYCPLCGSAMVFDRTIDGQVRQFGVSGLLYQSDVLLYDRETESLWSQLGLQAVSGSAAGTALDWLPSEYMTWAAWKQQHPDSEVLSTDTGYRRDYNSNAYDAYFASDETMFPVPHTRREFANKTWVVGVLINGEAKAYPVDTLPTEHSIHDTVGGKAITVSYHAEGRQPQVTDAQGNAVAAVLVFWFAWQAFYPATAIWTNN